jgi:hypothetical protein
MTNEIKNYKIILEVLNDYFKGTTGDIKSESLEKCAEEIVNKISEDKSYFDHLRSQTGGVLPKGVIKGYMRTVR